MENVRKIVLTVMSKYLPYEVGQIFFFFLHVLNGSMSVKC